MITRSFLSAAGVVAILLLCGCEATDDGSGADAHGQGDETPGIPEVAGRVVVAHETYDSLDGQSGGEFAGVPSICELAFRFGGGAGVYEVSSLTGVSESWSDDTGEQVAPAIWVELDAVGAVSDTAQDNLFLRLRGGPNADGTFVEPDVALDVGSDYLVLYTTPRDALMGYPTTAEHGVLQVSDGRLEGLFGTYSLSGAEFLELYDSAQAAVEHLRPSNPSEMVVVDWESECPTDTLLLPTPYDTSEQSHDGPMEGTEYGRPDAAGM